MRLHARLAPAPEQSNSSAYATTLVRRVYDWRARKRPRRATVKLLCADNQVIYMPSSIHFSSGPAAAEDNSFGWLASFSLDNFFLALSIVSRQLTLAAAAVARSFVRSVARASCSIVEGSGSSDRRRPLSDPARREKSPPILGRARAFQILAPPNCSRLCTGAEVRGAGGSRCQNTAQAAAPIGLSAPAPASLSLLI